MSARKHYINLPTDYIQELRRDGLRLKAMAFIDYYVDVVEDRINSQRFYAKAWGVSKTTSMNWLKDFKRETALFTDYWELKNAQQNSSAKNQGDHQVTTSRPEKTSISPENRGLEEEEKPASDHQVTTE